MTNTFVGVRKAGRGTGVIAVERGVPPSTSTDVGTSAKLKVTVPWGHVRGLACAGEADAECAGEQQDDEQPDA